MNAKEFFTPLKQMAALGAITNANLLELQAQLNEVSDIAIRINAANENHKRECQAIANVYGIEASQPTGDREATCQ